MADFDLFDVGTVSFPLASQTATADLLQVCDPALAKMIDFLSFVIDRKVGACIASATANKNPPIPVSIRQKMSLDPRENVTNADQVAFPLFAVWRDESKVNNRTLTYQQDVCRMGFAYILPAMTLDQAQRLAHLRHAVLDVIRQRLFLGFDPAYNSGERIVGGNLLATARCTEARYERFHIGDQTDSGFHALVGQLEVTDLTEPNTTGLADLTGADITITNQDTNDAPDVPVEILSFSTDHP